MNSKLPTSNFQLPTGFTLIEAMVAVTILTLSIAGPLVAANSAFVASLIARDRLTASYLAQEGIEYVRAMRDKEFLTAYPSGDGWSVFKNGIEAYCRDSLCTLDPVLRQMGYGPGSALASCSGSCGKLHRRSDGVYTQQSIGEQTVFTRTIRVDDVSETDERIISTVSWDYHGSSYFITITNNLTPWQ